MQAMICYLVDTTDPEVSLLFPLISEARAYRDALKAHLAAEKEKCPTSDAYEMRRHLGYEAAGFEARYLEEHPGVCAVLSGHPDDY